MQKLFHGDVIFTAKAELKPWSDQPDDYTSAIDGKIVAYVRNSSGDEGTHEDAGSLKMVLVHTVEAVNNRTSLVHVFDATQLLTDVYEVLMDSEGEIKDELDVEPGWHNVLVLTEATIDKRFEATHLLAQAIDTAGATLCSSGLVVTHRDVLAQVAKEDIERLGFREIEDGYLLRDNQCKHPGLDGLDEE